MEHLLYSQLRLALCCNVILIHWQDDDFIPTEKILYSGHSFDVPEPYLHSPVASIRPGNGCLIISLGD